MSDKQRPRTYDRSSERTAGKTSDSETTSESPREKTTCSECGGELSEDPSTGEYACEDCGLIVDDKNIDRGPEWRAFNASERDSKSRVGPARTELRHDRGLTTTIDWKDKDAYGNQLSASKRAQMQRLRTWDKRAKQDKAERGIAYANGEIMRMGSALGTPESVQETAASLYRQAQDAGLIPGRSIEGVASASLYIALRVHDQPRSLDEVSTVSRVDRRPISRTQRYLCRELNIALEPTDPSQYLPRFADSIDGDQDLIRTAEQLLNEIPPHNLSGRSPTVLAASALYAASLVEGELVTQHDVHKAADVTTVSIRNNYEMFLAEVDAIPVTESDLEETTSPQSLARQLNDSISYRHKDTSSDESEDQTETAHLSSKSNDSETTNRGNEAPNADDGHSSAHVADPAANDTGESNEGRMSESENDTPDQNTATESVKSTETADPGFDEDREESGTETADPEPEDTDTESSGEKTGNGFSCDDCDQAFDSERGLNIHRGRIHKQSDTDSPDSDDSDEETAPFECDACEESFDSKRGRNIHAGRVHKDDSTTDSEPVEEGEFECGVCGDTFDSEWGRNIHRGRVHDVDPEPVDETPEDAAFQCGVCGDGFDSERGLNIHKGIAHDTSSDDEPSEQTGEYDCEYCKFACDSYAGLRIHQGYEHDGQRNEDDPGPRTEAQAALAAFPDDEYNFTCFTCDRVFGTYKGVGIHLGRVHDEDTQGREEHAVDPNEYPVTPPEHSSETNTEAETVESRIGPEFRTAVTEFFAELDDGTIDPAIARLAESLLLTGGRNVGTNTYRTTDSAIGAALYAASQLLGEPVANGFSKRTAARLVGTTTVPIKAHYESYLDILGSQDNTSNNE